LKLYITGVVTLSVFALAVATLVFPADQRIGMGIAQVSSPSPGSHSTIEMALGVGFWVLLTMVTSALPVRLPHGTYQAVALAPLVAAMSLGGPAVGGWVAAVGTTETREIRGRIPWYGTLVNHAGLVLPVVAAGVIRLAIVSIATPAAGSSVAIDFVATIIAAVALFIGNTAITAGTVALRTGQSFTSVVIGDYRDTAFNNIAMGPIGWLMGLIYSVEWWATLLFALPLYTTRMASRRFVEMRDMFTQTIGALAAAVDKRDPFTARHSERVQQIAVDIGREMRVSESDLEALEWGGLLHDVGKIGVPDDVLKKADRLTRDERMQMNAHPVLGAEIIAPVAKLAAELPIIRHHHEWYNGSGYPDRLIGDEIPKLARILHVADAFEAMTAKRPYRMAPLSSEEALAELRKFAGVQFDPQVVDAFVKTHWAEGVPDAGRPMENRPIPLLAQAAAERMAGGRVDAGVANAGAAAAKVD
jgi:putative nucleotidyltransferase with HDIG domain